MAMDSATATRLRASAAARARLGRHLGRQCAQVVEEAAQAGAVAFEAEAVPGARRNVATRAAGSPPAAGFVRGRARRGRSSHPRARIVAIASEARAPNTSPSSSELLGSRFAPCTPVPAASPRQRAPAASRGR